ncbi:MAG: NAD-dependent epimerase/dehydratase family protein [Thermoanaerobaculia bacterium]|nr:NAD-dependent epimerase/dehydratase family protein [Thermoanaerobaculia bacterium]
MRALVVGGTGPTGPGIVRGLLERGYEVAILHRGSHESDAIPPEVEHIHTDPHFLEPLNDALRGRAFDLVVATYGRIRHVAAALVDKTPRLIAVGGTPLYRGLLEPASSFPTGLPVPVREDAPQVESEAENRFGYLIARTERTVMAYHEAGRYAATVVRYPLVYGPHPFSSPVWQIVRRALDHRPRIVLADGGLTLLTRGYVDNVARAVLLCVDRPERASGRVYNCGDEDLLSLRQWVEIIAATMGHEWEIVSLPDEVAAPVSSFVPFFGSSHHQVMDLTRIREELGYRDVVPVSEALPATVEWFVEHADEVRAGEAESDRPGPSYEAEDALAAIHGDSLERMRRVDVAAPEVYHPYPHPRKAGLERDHRRR